MANSAKKPAAAQTGNTVASANIDMAALLAALQMMQQQQAAPAAGKVPAKVVEVKAPAADPASMVEAAVKAAGGRVTRTGKAGVTAKGSAKCWIDCTFGSVRIQGNAFLIAAKK